MNNVTKDKNFEKIRRVAETTEKELRISRDSFRGLYYSGFSGEYKQFHKQFLEETLGEYTQQLFQKSG